MTSVQNIEERAAQWLAREDGGISAADHAARDAWLGEAVSHRIAYLRLKEAWKRADVLGEAPLVFAATKPRRALRIMGWGALAAGLAIACLAGAWPYLYPKPPLPASRQISSASRQRMVLLADGTSVQLDSHTTIQTEVRGDARAVILDKGQAYFVVQHNARHPFAVVVGNRRITDLGTRFAVQRSGDGVEVVVEEGKVRVDVLDSAVPAVIANGGKMVIAKADQTLVIAKRPDEIAHELGWRFPPLVFDQETLADAAAQFNRYNERKIVVSGKARVIRIGGAFRRDNIQVFAQLVRQGFGLKIRETDTQIVISE